MQPGLNSSLRITFVTKKVRRSSKHNVRRGVKCALNPHHTRRIHGTYHTHCYESDAPHDFIKILIKDIKIKTSDRCSSLRGILDLSPVVASEFSWYHFIINKYWGFFSWQPSWDRQILNWVELFKLTSPGNASFRARLSPLRAGTSSSAWQSLQFSEKKHNNEANQMRKG